MGKIMTATEAVSSVKDGDVIMVGGFGVKGFPGRVVRALLKTSNAENLFLIANSVNMNQLHTLEKLLKTRASRMITTFIRNSPAAAEKFSEGKLELVPQGTFIERIRAGGAGIPAFFTPVGIGTEVEKGKEKIEIDGREYLMEKAIRANVALIRASKVDLSGNCFMRGSTKTFGALMPAAAEYTVVEAEEIVPVGAIDPELVTVPGILIDAIVKVGV